MREVDRKEHEVAGCDVGRVSTGGDSHVTVRLQSIYRGCCTEGWVLYGANIRTVYFAC